MAASVVGMGTGALSAGAVGSKDPEMVATPGVDV
jgi:hypothetical protein